MNYNENFIVFESLIEKLLRGEKMKRVMKGLSNGLTIVLFLLLIMMVFVVISSVMNGKRLMW